MLEFARTIPANCKKIKETYVQSKAFKRFPNTHQRKSRFGLTKGAGQCFIFWNGMCEKALVVFIVYSCRLKTTTKTS